MEQGNQGRLDARDRAFSVRTEHDEEVQRVQVLGEMDLAVVGELDTVMRRAEASDATRIELDLDQLEFLDVSGVRLLLDLDRRSRGNGRRLRIRPANSPQVRRVLELTGAEQLLPIQA